MSKKHRVVFAGTPDFSVPSLQALLDSEHDVVAVYTQPDRPAGRGRELTPSPVKRLASSHGIPVCQPEHFKNPETVAALNAWDADVLVVVAYGLLLPQSVLDTPRFGCINVHASILPRWRGASPIQQAVLHGDKESGVTIMAMVKAMDAGDMYHIERYALAPDETTGSLHDRLAKLGPPALLSVLSSYPDCSSTPQDKTLVTYAPKITKQDARLNWQQPARDLERSVRAYSPWPVAHTAWRDKTIRVHKASLLHAESTESEPGVVLGVSDEGIDVQCGKGVLRLLRIQLPGGKAMPVSAWWNAHRESLSVGDRLM